MIPTTDELRRRRLIVLAIAIVLLLAAFAAYVLLEQRAQPSRAVTSQTQSPHAPQATPAPTQVAEFLGALPSTADPESFARSVVHALFVWDTTTLVGRSDHVEQLMKVADPTGESTVGLLADANGYLPTDAAWRDLAQYGTRQWLDIESVTTPTKWAQAKAQAAGQLLPGTAALTVRGTRRRAGVWNGDPVVSEHEVGFTIFIVCGPSYPRCHLLRLSILDKPLG